MRLISDSINIFSTGKEDQKIIQARLLAYISACKDELIRDEDQDEDPCELGFGLGVYDLATIAERGSCAGSLAVIDKLADHDLTWDEGRIFYENDPALKDRTNPKIVLNDEIPKPYYPVEEPPRILYHAARLKACYHIYRHGLKAAGRPYLPLAITKELALRIGKRRDKSPLLLEISAQEAFLEGIIFRCHGTHMFLAKEIPPRFISGPPLPERE